MMEYSRKQIRVLCGYSPILTTSEAMANKNEARVVASKALCDGSLLLISQKYRAIPSTVSLEQTALTLPCLRCRHLHRMGLCTSSRIIGNTSRTLRGSLSRLVSLMPMVRRISLIIFEVLVHLQSLNSKARNEFPDPPLPLGKIGRVCVRVRILRRKHRTAPCPRGIQYTLFFTYRHWYRLQMADSGMTQGRKSAYLHHYYTVSPLSDA